DLVLAMLWASASAGSGQPIDPIDPQYQYGVNMARQICGSIAAELRDRWLYYDNFRSYRITLSVGGPVESYGCTIAATHMNTGEVREVRVDIDRREGSERFSYRFIPELRSEEHTSELQSRENLVCRLLLEKKNERRSQSSLST